MQCVSQKRIMLNRCFLITMKRLIEKVSIKWSRNVLTVNSSTYICICVCAFYITILELCTANNAYVQTYLKCSFGAGGVAQVVEYLWSNCEALSSNPSTKKRKRKKNVAFVLMAGATLTGLMGNPTLGNVFWFLSESTFSSFSFSFSFSPHSSLSSLSLFISLFIRLSLIDLLGYSVLDLFFLYKFFPNIELT
jgi:hypothetical protein